MTDTKRDSFTSADSMPIKLIQNPDIIKYIDDTHTIPAYHVQFIPTNKCNMSCDFCSCEEEDRTIEMPFKRIKPLVSELKEIGTKAATVTGGGEPLMHKNIGDVLMTFYNNDIKTGLVTNGLKLKDIHPDYLNTLTWCRISNGDFRTFTDKYAESIAKVVESCPDVDWAFSHVVSSKPNVAEIKRVIEFANQYKFTHVRLVADLFQPKEVPMGLVAMSLENYLGVDTSRVIYQARQQPEKGMDCYIAYLKPLIAADGNIYRCCGVQYAINGKYRKMPKELSMGNIDNLQKSLIDYSTVKDGNQCDTCYYGNYNRTLESLLKNVEHKDFV